MKTFPNIDIRSISGVTGVALDFDEVESGNEESPAYMRLELKLADGRTLILQTGDTEEQYLVDCVIDAEYKPCGETGGSSEGGVPAPVGNIDEPVYIAAAVAGGDTLTHVLSMAEPQTDPARLLST